MPGAGPDPFELVKADIQDSLTRAQTDFGQWQSSRASPGKRAELSGSIEDECKSMAWQVEELSKAVDVAEKNTLKFGLTQADIMARRKWIMQTKREVDRIQAALRAPQRDVPPSPTRKLNRAINEENERFIGSELENQQQVVRQQDEDLDQLGESVTRIGHLGLTIHEELNQQGTMLDELDEDVEGTSARLAAAQKRINHVLTKAGMRGQLCIIVFLIAVLAVLVVVAFS